MGDERRGNLRRVQDAPVEGKVVLVRVDYNVPMHNGAITDDQRIRASLPTIRLLQDRGARIVLATHLGRPEGQRVPEFSTEPLAARLGELLGGPVRYLPDCIGDAVRREVEQAEASAVFVLENVRYHPGEEANDPAFAAELARVADVYVDDAFGTVHRAHASTVGVAAILPAYAGLLVQQEVKALRVLMEDPARPYVAIVGGKKAQSKLGPIRDLLPRIDAVLIGGGVAFTFLRASGASIGESVVDEQFLDEARAILQLAENRSVRVVLPEDVLLAQRFDAGADVRVGSAREIPAGWMGVDIGPETIRRFAAEIAGARTILWTGPMGAFEIASFAAGTRGVAEAVAESRAFSVVGGGETGDAVASLGFGDRMSYISTGGGACLAFVRGKTLPALEVLES